MRLQIHNRQAASLNRLLLHKEKLPEKPSGKLPFLLLAVILVVACVGFAHKTFIESDSNGQPKLAEWRKEKLNRELNDLDDAQQYVLRAKVTGLYPCFSCIDKKKIKLNAGEVYKYGFTTKNEAGRYRRSLESKKLIYFVQYEGSITDCMKEERRKIYYYAVLPENIIRVVPLIRPPGNKQDN